MTESTYSNNRVRSLFLQIKDAIHQLLEWNKYVSSPEDYYSSPDGMKNLAASCMLIEAVAEGLKQVGQPTMSNLLFRRT